MELSVENKGRSQNAIRIRAESLVVRTISGQAAPALHALWARDFVLSVVFTRIYETHDKRNTW